MPDISSLAAARAGAGSPSSARVQQPPAPPAAATSSSTSSSTPVNIDPHHHHRHVRVGGGGGGSEHPRSGIGMTLNLHDPPTPYASTEPSVATNANTRWATASPSSLSPLLPTADPHHRRTPSLGELHQQLEQEQEAQVNRLLQMIRQQQSQIRLMQQAAGQLPSDATAAVAGDDSTTTPTSERSWSFASVGPGPGLSLPPPRSPAVTTSTTTAPTTGPGQHRTSFDFPRRPSRSSRTPSRTASPALRPHSAGLSAHGDGPDASWIWGGTRDDVAFYQAETQMLSRENQMLRVRLRELERQLGEHQRHPHPAPTSHPPSARPSISTTDVTAPATAAAVAASPRTSDGSMSSAHRSRPSDDSKSDLA